MKKNTFIIFVGIISLVIMYAEAEKKIVCYYGSWSTYRHGNGQFNVNDIDPILCTHVIYSFFGITQDATVRILDPYLDLEENWGRGNIKKFNALKQKNPKLKTLAAVGGWNEGSATFSVVSKSAGKRLKFARDAANFCKKYGFDGLDMDWEYPSQRDGNQLIDKRNFVLLLKELREQFDKDNLLLSAAVAAAQPSASLSYDIPNISGYLHFINIMAYDLHGPWDMRLGHNAPLYEGLADVTPQQKQLNVNSSIQYWLSQGAPREKLILGMPLYGRSFTIRDSPTAVGSFHSGPGIGGQYTNEPGMIGYNEFCEKQKSNHWSRNWDRLQQVPYAYSGNQWITYDDIESISIKSALVLDLDLGGAMVWSVETDDFRGLCPNGKYPLLSAINTVLNGKILPSTPNLLTTTEETFNESKIIDDILATIETTSTPVIETPTQSTQSTAVFSTVTTNKPTNSPISDCISNGVFRDPTDCAAFFVCDSQRKNHLRCPSPLLFDDVLKVCNWASEVFC